MYTDVSIMDSNEWHRGADDGKQGQLVKETIGI